MYRANYSECVFCFLVRGVIRAVTERRMRWKSAGCYRGIWTRPPAGWTWPTERSAGSLTSWSQLVLLRRPMVGTWTNVWISRADTRGSSTVWGFSCLNTLTKTWCGELGVYGIEKSPNCVGHQLTRTHWPIPDSVDVFKTVFFSQSQSCRKLS